VVIAASDPLQRCGLRVLLSDGAVRLEGEAATEAQLRATLMARRPHVIVAAGVDRATVLVVAQVYQVPVVLALPCASDVHLLAQMPEVAGVVLATAPDAAAQLLAAVVAVAAGGRYHAVAPLDALGHEQEWSRAAALTPQERKLLALDGPGVAPETLAQALGVSRTTVLHYRSRIRRKLVEAGVEGRVLR
jgi:DNA-binding NarL/FixJ family response regulator